MRLLHVLISITSSLVVGTARQSAAQTVAIANVIEAPFTATWSWTRIETRTDGTQTSTVVATAQLARDSYGSTYEADFMNGHLTAIWIVDVSKNRRITINSQNSTYRYLPISEPAGKLRTHSVGEIFKELQGLLEGFNEHPDRPAASGASWHFTSLGCHAEKGFNLCGLRDEVSSDTQEHHVRDTWWSDLGLMISSLEQTDHLTGSEKGLRSVTYKQEVAALQRADPSSELFDIPTGFTLESSVSSENHDGR